MISGETGRSGSRGIEATVVELLPRSVYRVELADRTQVLAHPAARREVNFVRLRPGDKVKVVISAHDTTRGRITELMDKG